ncbi:MAG TPA: urea carboxylase [Acidimicrobiia bacterium]|nr:urea carboxylase [Acidimicrobiia bacterium]
MQRVLVANRGEIACRIMRTLDRLAIESIAVYTDADRDSLHCDLATVAVPLGAADDGGYRSIERLVGIAIEHGADGVHPGYGFLAEDADFADAVERAGLAFIGPTPEQLRRFGAKDEARRAAAAAGLPLPAGTGAFTSAADAVAAAGAVGFPLLVKSVAGGGGIGMLACHDEADLPDTVERAMRQSEAAFGRAAVFLERLVARARHVEVQVFGDGHGRVVSLGERDCSAQRRRQKVLEESPAPGLDEQLRADLAEAACALLASVSYRSAGTVEFVLDVDTGEFFFLEVNTRLQVEHGVTEAVTGVDLVEWMVRGADGDHGFLDAAELGPPVGHAIEARIYAEDPTKAFQPSPGVITEVSWPPDARVDTWIRTGTDVPPVSDPLLGKVIVHGNTRADAVEAMRRALAATVVRGVETNRGLLASFVDAPVFRDGLATTASLEAHVYEPATVDVLVPGHTTVQDLPGRVGLWHVGVPPSGPMDDRSFRVGNRILGNAEGAPGLECTALGPTLRFARDATVCLAGAPTAATCDGLEVPWWEPFVVGAGQTLTVGPRSAAGLRTYLLVRGGFDVGTILGSGSTFTLGGFGGHGGRELRTGDVLHVAPAPDGAAGEPLATDAPVDRDALPVLSHEWELAVVDGPHGAPDFVTEAGIAAFYATEWVVHHHSSRTGVRLVGPTIEWARDDGGEAGLHPSNVHDTPYTVGAVDFTGDMPIVLGPDGPSLGGFTCPVTVIADERWKLGQLAPGDRVRFVPVDLDEARARETATARAIAGGTDNLHVPRRRSAPAPTVLATRPVDGDRPQVTYRAQGDHAVLVEYGPMTLDFDLRLRAGALSTWLETRALPGIVEVTPGIRSLQVQFDPTEHTPHSMLEALSSAEDELPDLDEVVVDSRTVHLPLSWDDPATRDAIATYMRVVRDDAPWCPWNIEFIRRVNGLRSTDAVRDVVFSAEYLVLGLGDVYLGAPVAVPVDPRHRLVTTKYNPARTWTPENAVGIGGAYLCIYGMEGPGGYQFVGRTVPVWDRFGRGPHTDAREPWLLRAFDRIRWYPVGADELLDLRAQARSGRLDLRVDDGSFSRAQHRAFLGEHAAAIGAFQHRRERAFADERARWEADGEMSRQHEAPIEMAAAASSAVDALPDGAFVIESPLHGSVARLLVSVGARVAPGDPIVGLEAMKTESVVPSPVGGTVVQILCDTGALVASGAPLVVVQTDG